ncbi:hypothetical protein NM208_g1852 [Fusarium decemcellulare]|uniref:Uncharacterized protein n=1 Tax=Fusarium decemcellulare TaxID=57161 RepID=A0ACC1SUX0_9HYPO|nr:hypothetical protein NM208_g1852 [Fusarium decemcellulare]
MTDSPTTVLPPSSCQSRGLLKDQLTDAGQDSGYATQSSSPDGQSAVSTSGCLSANPADRRTRLAPTVLNQIADLAEFDKPIDDAILVRFNQVHTQIEKPLLNYIRSKLPGRKYRPIALRLMILGRSEDDAKPYIVVLCPEQQFKRINKFFDKSSVRKICRPDDDTSPSFEVLVFGRPPEPKASEDIDVLISIVGDTEGYTAETYCGAPIIIRQPSGREQRCTLGGIIKTISLDGEFKMYGVTVGHVLLDNSEDDVTFGATDDEAEVSNDCGLELSESGSEHEDGSEDQADEDVNVVEEPQSVSVDGINRFESWVSLKKAKIGCISRDYPSVPTDSNEVEAKSFYDWALIDMCDYKSNLLRARNFGSGEVLKNGPGEEFVDTLVLSLDGDKKVVDGDSGSWVVDGRTLEVHGYLVAADAFGGGYVIPMAQAFQNIKDTLGVQSVGLATPLDIANLKLTEPGADDGLNLQDPLPSGSEAALDNHVSLSSGVLDSRALISDKDHLDVDFKADDGEGCTSGQKRPRDDDDGKQGKKRKKQQKGDVNNDGGDGRNRNKPDGHRFPKPEEPPNESFECPFYKHDPDRYQDCKVHRLRRFSDVEQHIDRMHVLKNADVYCTRCRMEFHGPGKHERLSRHQGKSMELERNPDERHKFCPEGTIKNTGLILPAEYDLIEKAVQVGKPVEVWNQMRDGCFTCLLCRHPTSRLLPVTATGAESTLPSALWSDIHHIQSDVSGIVDPLFTDSSTQQGSLTPQSYPLPDTTPYLAMDNHKPPPNPFSNPPTSFVSSLPSLSLHHSLDPWKNYSNTSQLIHNDPPFMLPKPRNNHSDTFQLPDSDPFSPDINPPAKANSSYLTPPDESSA